MAGLLKDLPGLFSGGLRLALGTDAAQTARWLALLLVCASLIWLIVFRTRLRMRWPQRILLSTLRTLAVAFLILALLDLTQTVFRRALAVVLLVDVSPSIAEESLEEARRLVAEAERTKGDAVLKLVTFGAAPREAAGLEGIARHDERPETNLQAALHAAYDLFPKGYTARALFLTDGNQTHGDLVAEADVARDLGVRVSFLPLPGRAEKDALVQSLNIPRRARTGEEVRIGARVLSSHAGPATVSLVRGSGVLERRALDLAAGENWVEFTTIAVGRGIANYAVEVQTGGDADPANDRMTASLEVLDRPRVLFITRDAEGDQALVNALTDRGIRVDPAPVEAFPTLIGELNYFDLVLLSDPDPETLGPGVVDLLGRYLRDFGGGLVFLGGEKTADLAKKDRRFPVADLLPLKFKEKKKTEPNPIAMMLVLDKSNSMGRENKFGMAIRAAKDAIAELPPKSKVGVVCFDDRPYLTVEMTPVDQAQAVAAKLDTLGVDGGTSIFPALELAYHKIRREPETVRHVILLSDGYSNSRYQQNVQLVEEFKKKKITITTVGLGRECDPRHLQTIADQGGGKFYHVLDADEIPRIFIKETKRITTTNVVEKPFQPRAVKKGDLVAGVDLDMLPGLSGYNAADPKPSSETFLLAEGEDPLLSRWHVGLGRAVVFASDAGNRWAAAWKEWAEYAPFFAGIVRGTMRDANLQLLRVAARAQGERARVEVDASDTRGNFLNNLTLKMQVTPPDGAESAIALRQVRPGGYAGEFPLLGYGSYAIRVTPEIEGRRAAETFSRILLTPPSEFVPLADGPSLMRRVAARTGGSVVSDVGEVFAPAEKNFPEEKPLWPYLVLGALGVYMVSLPIRRT